MAYFQDDQREAEMIALFGLFKDAGEGRAGVDAFLDLEGRRIPFELKTTSNGSVTTVRDFGMDHIQKWQGKHWLIGFFVRGEIFYKYGSPAMMQAWIDEKAGYIAPDFKLAGLSVNNLSLNDLYQVLGQKVYYSLADAQQIQKRQYAQQKYRALQDVSDGYSPARMLEILQDRVRYLVERGSTLNNPHIPESYFAGWERITNDHAAKLREMVKQSI